MSKQQRNPARFDAILNGSFGSPDAVRFVNKLRADEALEDAAEAAKAAAEAAKAAEALEAAKAKA